MKINSIIVEGADQQGKSTFCRFLSGLLGWKIVHYGLPEKWFDFDKDYMIDPGWISDRNFISEVVYSQIRGEKNRLKKDIMYMLGRFAERGTLVIILNRTNWSFEDRSEEFTYCQIRKAKTLYEEFTKEYEEQVRMIDPEDYEQVMNLLKYISHENLQASKPGE